MSVLFCPSQDRHRSWTGRAGYRGCCFVLTRLRVVCFPCCHFSLFFTGPGTPHSFRRPPVTSVPITPQSVRRPPKETPPPNKREVFPICAARAGLFAPPVLSSFFLFCLRTFQFGEQQTKKKRRQATTQPPPRPDSPKGAGLFSTNTKTNRALLPPPPVPVAVFRIGRRKMPLSGMRPFYATERREKNHPEEAEASVFYTNCAILAAPRFLPATPSQPHLCVSPAKFPLHTPEGAPPPARYFRLALSLFSPSRFRSRRGIKTFAPFGLYLRPTFMVGTQEKRGAPHLFRLGLHRATAQRPRPKTNAHSPFAGFLLLMNCCRRRESAQMRPPVPC
jgi:hypothetical protein